MIEMYTLRWDKYFCGPGRELKLVAWGKAEVIGSKAGNRQWRWLVIWLPKVTRIMCPPSGEVSIRLTAWNRGLVRIGFDHLLTEAWAIYRRRPKSWSILSCYLWIQRGKRGRPSVMHMQIISSGLGSMKVIITGQRNLLEKRALTAADKLLKVYKLPVENNRRK